MPNQFTHPWTEDEIDFLQQNIKKLTYKQMGGKINRSPASIQSKIRYLPFQQKIKKYFLNTNFFKVWSPEMAYILGFIAADGNICKTGRAHMLHIACDDEDVIVKVKNVIEYQGPIHKKPRDNGKISYSLRICDSTIFRDLQNLNITERKSLTFTPPKIPQELTWHFVRGYFDGDGSVFLKSSAYPSKLGVNIYTASFNMSLYLHKTIRELLGELYMGVVYVRTADQKIKYYAVRIGHKAAVKLFYYMYNDSTIHLERKYNKFVKGMNYGA